MLQSLSYIFSPSLFSTVNFGFSVFLGDLRSMFPDPTNFTHLFKFFPAMPASFNPQFTLQDTSSELEHFNGFSCANLGFRRSLCFQVFRTLVQFRRWASWTCIKLFEGILFCYMLYIRHPLFVLGFVSELVVLTLLWQIFDRELKTGKIRKTHLRLLTDSRWVSPRWLVLCWFYVWDRDGRVQ